jgi:hypothetical protein
MIPETAGVRTATIIGFAASLCTVGAADGQELIAFAGSHVDPGYVAQHLERIESRPFDGMVINEYLGRNLLNMRLKDDAPRMLDASSGAVTYAAAAGDLAPLKGVFKKFRHNFAKVNFNMVGVPPLLNADADWRVVEESAANYARAVRDTGLRGIFFDNESYLPVAMSGSWSGANYWIYEDQLALAGQSRSLMPLVTAVALARQRGRELMQAFVRGYPSITVIVAHGPHEGCDAWRSASGHFGMDHYLLGAFAAGMLEGSSGEATLVDGGEDYDLRNTRDFALARAWRKGIRTPGAGSITDLGPMKCPFMDAGLAADWPGKSNIAFSTFDKERASLTTNNWTAISNVAQFQSTLTNALRASDRYVWHYTQWQDWWGDTMEDVLKPWSAAIEAARRDAHTVSGSSNASLAGR